MIYMYVYIYIISVTTCTYIYLPQTLQFSETLSVVNNFKAYDEPGLQE